MKQEVKKAEDARGIIVMPYTNDIDHIEKLKRDELKRIFVQALTVKAL